MLAAGSGEIFGMMIKFISSALATTLYKFLMLNMDIFSQHCVYFVF